MINELNFKRRGGNVGLKLDITQDYDSLSWDYLFEVLRRFGLSEIGISWLRIFFESAMISVLVNGGPCGFFGVGRGLRQGDTLSPILFILAEEFLSKNLSKMVQEGRVQAMVTRVNKNKSKCFVGGVSNTIRIDIVEYLQMGLSELPDTIPIYNMAVYKWPETVIKECEKIIRNSLWSGDPAVKTLVTVKWDEVNAPLIEGGLGVRRLEVMNKALLMKLLWKIETEEVEWTQFMRAKYKNKNNEWISSYKQSSIWPGIK
ncbi:uncharacterized protein LOC113272641 [Papaver somniferum]|uniref:uncharacterized protein LOC113272641 n=1 Tax=Papaver somniferum TaxID=3469 RepID=UPI000E70337F|nr:uncharacterized protein LOC113272641 [Papaver somniferum]